MNNSKEQTGKEGITLDPKEYLKRKGLKNPPIDSGISGGGDNQPVRPSDVMLEFAKTYSRHRLIVLIEENSNYCNRIAELESQIQDLEPKFTELEMECKRLKAELKRKDEALRTLVNLKEHKEFYGKDDFYLGLQPKAWAKAEQALKLIEP